MPTSNRTIKTVAAESGLETENIDFKDTPFNTDSDGDVDDTWEESLRKGMVESTADIPTSGIDMREVLICDGVQDDRHLGDVVARMGAFDENLFLLTYAAALREADVTCEGEKLGPKDFQIVLGARMDDQQAVCHAPDILVKGARVPLVGRPLDLRCRAHIHICKKNKRSKISFHMWPVVDRNNGDVLSLGEGNAVLRAFRNSAWVVNGYLFARYQAIVKQHLRESSPAPVKCDLVHSVGSVVMGHPRPDLFPLFGGLNPKRINIDDIERMEERVDGKRLRFRDMVHSAMLASGLIKSLTEINKISLRGIFDQVKAKWNDVSIHISPGSIKSHDGQASTDINAASNYFMHSLIRENPVLASKGYQVFLRPSGVDAMFIRAIKRINLHPVTPDGSGAEPSVATEGSHDRHIWHTQFFGFAASGEAEQALLESANAIQSFSGAPPETGPDLHLAFSPRVGFVDGGTRAAPGRHSHSSPPGTASPSAAGNDAGLQWQFSPQGAINRIVIREFVAPH